MIIVNEKRKMQCVTLFEKTIKALVVCAASESRSKCSSAFERGIHTSQADSDWHPVLNLEFVRANFFLGLVGCCCGGVFRVDVCTRCW